MKKEKELKTIYLDLIDRQQREKWEGLQESLQETLAEISLATNQTFSTVEELEEISEDWLTKQIETSRTNLSKVLGAGCFIPPDISWQFAENYHKIRRKCLPLVDSFSNTLEYIKEKGVGIYFNGNVPYLNESDVERKVKEAATQTLTETQREGWKYVSAIVNALNNLRSWERANKMKPGNILKLLSENNYGNTLRGVDNFDIDPKSFFQHIGLGNMFRREEETLNKVPFDD